MRKSYLRFAVSLVWISAAHVNAALLPAGKCDNREYNTSGHSIQKVISQRLWRMVWITDSPELASIDHGIMHFSTDLQSHDDLIHNEAVLTDGSRITNTCVFKDVGLGYFVEECMNDDGSLVVFRDYCLYFVETKGGVYLRCVEGDGVTVASNTVILAVTGHPPLTNTQVQVGLQLNLQIFGIPLRPLAWAVP